MGASALAGELADLNEQAQAVVERLWKNVDDLAAALENEQRPSEPAGQQPFPAAGESLSEFARALNDDVVPTGHGGRQWWPPTVRSVLHRAENIQARPS